LGIVYLQPRFENILQVNNNVLKKVWLLFTISIAAQLATLPLGIYYFHQFPVYFWLANLFVVPVATLVLYFGVAALVLNWTPIAGALLFKIHFWLIWGMNEFNLWLTRFPNAIINGLTITELQAGLLYGLILLLILFFARKKLLYFGVAVCFVAILSLQMVRKVIKQQDQHILAIYNLRGSTAVAFIEHKEATLVGKAGLTPGSSDYEFNVRPHMWHLGIDQPATYDLYAINKHISHALLPDSNSLFVWQGLKLLLLSKPLHYLPTSNIDYLVLSENVPFKEKDISQLKIGKVIIDASNTPWHRKKLHELLKAKAIPYVDVAESGAYLLELK
jgi:competence protein ComEC